MPSPFTPTPNDGAIQLLRAIFGPAIDTIIGASQAGVSSLPTMLSEGFRFFNSGVLFFGTIVMLWVTVTGVTNTANDGVALGKKWSTFYTPLRTLTAAATLIPSGSGYAFIQIIILFIVCSSIGFASNLWGAVVKYAVGDDVAHQAISSIASDPRFESIAIGALKMQVCANAVNQSLSFMSVGQPIKLALRVEREAPSESTSLWPGSNKPFLGTTQTYRTQVFFQDPSWATSEDICGRIVFTETYDAPATTSTATSDVTRSLQQALTLVRQRYIETLFQPGQPITQAADQIAATANGRQATFQSQVVRDALDHTRFRLTHDIAQEVTKQVKAQNGDVIQKLSENGWIYAGSLYLELARIKDAVRSATTSQAEYLDGRGGLKGVLAGDYESAASSIFDTHMIILSTALKKAQSRPASNTGTSPRLPVLNTTIGAADFADGGNGLKTMITSWTNGLSMSLLSGVVHHMSDPDENPIFKVKNVGDWLSSSAMVAITSQAVLGATIEGVKDGAAAESNQQGIGIPLGILAGYASGAAALLGKTWEYISPAMTTILYAGHYLGIWVPLIPFFVFSLGVVGWVIFVAEMLVAGMLWMAAHIVPSNDGSFIGSQAQGYLLIVSGFFRPALMILGLVFSVTVLGPLIQYINEGFLIAVRATQANAVTGLFSLASIILCYCFLITAVFMLVFSLPQTFPDRILRWIGAGIGDMGEQQTMSRLDSSASNQARAAAISGAARFASTADRGRDIAKGDEDHAGQELSNSLHAASPEGISGQSASMHPDSEVPQKNVVDDPSPEY